MKLKLIKNIIDNFNKLTNIIYNLHKMLNIKNKNILFKKKKIVQMK